MITILPVQDESLVLIRQMDASFFRNSHLLRISNGKILNEIDLGDNEFYMFEKKLFDTVYITSAVLTTQMKVNSFNSGVRHIKLEHLNIKIKTAPMYGSGWNGMEECNIIDSYFKNDIFKVQCEKDVKSFNPDNIFFINDAIYFYQLKKNVLSTAYIGSQQWLGSEKEFRPFLNGNN